MLFDIPHIHIVYFTLTLETEVKIRFRLGLDGGLYNLARFNSLKLI